MNKKLSRRQFNQSLMQVSALGLASSMPAISHSRWDLNWFNDEDTHNERWLSAQGREAKDYSLGWINPQEPSSAQFVFVSLY